MYKNDYLNKTEELVNNNQYYTKLNRDPTFTLQLKANKLTKTLKDKGVIEEETAKNMTTYNSVAPRFYALPKIHKPQLSMRPIVSSLNGPNKSLATLLTNILTTAYDTNNDFYVKDSFQFSQFVNNHQLPDNYVIASFDVVSLFTNLPLDVILSSLENKWELISSYTTMDFQTFKEILRFIFDSNIFTFNHQYYKQIFGTPMGSKISPILVNYVLDDLVTECLDLIPFHIPFVKRYVDDLLLAIPKNRTEVVLDIFNSYNEHIQFTCEKEDNNSVPFLDMLVVRCDDNVLKTKWYRKPYCSNRFVNYHSYHPMKTKVNLILGMKRRAVKLSHPEYRKNALQELKTIFLYNSYPEKIINKFLFSTQYNIEENIIERQPLSLSFPSQSINLSNSVVNLQLSNTPNTELNNRYYSLPYIHNLTPKLITVFKNFDIKIAKKQTKTLNILYTKTKTPLNKLDNWNVIYRIACNQCELSYIGQTSRNLKGRLASHKSDCRRGLHSCALAEHVINLGHSMNWNNIEILDRADSYYKRILLEMLHINSEKTMNKKSDTQNLSSIYTYILQLEKENYRTLIDRPAPDE